MQSISIKHRDILNLHKKRAGHALDDEKYAIYQHNDLKLLIGFCNNKLTLLESIRNTDIINDYHACAFTDNVSSQLDEYFNGRLKSFNIPFKLFGTDFQMKVWDVLTKIPYGETRTYKDIAVNIANPKAYRAVGMANHNNPIMIVVPCHRVIGSSGKLIGYAGGIDIKAQLLNIEKINKNK